MSNLSCGFIGLGLIGGSIARAFRESMPDTRIIAYDTNQETLLLAKQEGIADTTVLSVDENFSDCDYIFLCAPVRTNDGNLPAIKKILQPGCILTDVGSVKTSIHKAVHEAGLDDCFIGGHPMTGSERVGFANSKASLLENAYYILTPTPATPAEKLNAYQKLVTKLGAIPLVLDYQKHDYVTAAISHLPHVIASSLVNLVRNSDSENGIMKMIAAGGFKDITRIASSSADVWQQICLSNAENISSLLSDYIEALTRFQEEIDAGNGAALFEQFNSARIYRDSFANAPSGPLKRSYCIDVDIRDKSGALAHVATLLANHNLSIKNVEISHNRESEDGILKIEFYDEAAMTMAADLLKTVRYTVNIRM